MHSWLLFFYPRTGNKKPIVLNNGSYKRGKENFQSGFEAVERGFGSWIKKGVAWCIKDRKYIGEVQAEAIVFTLASPVIEIE